MVADSVAVGLRVGTPVTVWTGRYVDSGDGTISTKTDVGVDTEVPVVGAGDRKSVCTASNRVSTSSKMIEFLNHSCAPPR